MDDTRAVSGSSTVSHMVRAAEVAGVISGSDTIAWVKSGDPIARLNADGRVAESKGAMVYRGNDQAET